MGHESRAERWRGKKICPLLERNTGIDGYPVESIAFHNGKPVSREQVVAIVDAVFTDADFPTIAAKKVD